LSLFLLGLPLAIIEDARQIYLPILIQFKQEDCINFTNIWLWLTDEFIGGNRLSEMAGTDVQQHLEITHNYQALYAFHLANLISGYTFGNYSLAVGHAALALKSEDAAYGILMSAAHNFYYSLALLALISSTQSPYELELDQVIANQKKLRHLANHAPSNFLHKLQLVEAEIYRVQGHRSEAIESYECAIATAKANQFIQEEALANELAAKFYLDWGKEKVAAGYMQEAYYGYARWGAKAKTDDLESRYPQLLRPILQAAAQSFNVFETLSSIAAPNLSIHSSTNISSSSSSSVNTVLDFAAIIKASQSLAGTIQLDELLHQLTHIILQNSGGDRCALILPNSGKEWSVVAIATPTSTELCAEPIEGNAKLPVKLIQYVKNTQEVVIVDEGKTELPVIGQYLSQHQPKSLLCLPILNQVQLMGILYLENSATSNVFTRDRIVILNFLCTQAAISITNAQLYAEKVKYTYTLEQKVAERTSELQCANEELYRLATMDGLTQVANRRHFDKQLDLEWERLKREQLALSLILFDVDYFKRYNDCYGHQAGDTCLIQVAQAATEGVCRAGDLVARYGGEEFVIVLPNTDLEGAIATAKRIQQALRAKAVPHERSEVNSIVSISLGITSVIPCSQLSPKMLISTADEALYVAKQQGRDRYAIGEIGASLGKSD
jgi:diguanylate cyclase (GGDEF)-like protein